MGGCEIIAGDINGTVTSFQQHDALWKINIAEESAKLSTLGLVSIFFFFRKEFLDLNKKVKCRKVVDHHQYDACYQLY